VWATKGRERWLSGALLRGAYRSIQSETDQMGCQILALGGMPDHVHLLAKTPSSVSAAALTK
jgi:putative transposase